MKKKKKPPMSKKWVLITCSALPVLGILGYFLTAPIRRQSKARDDASYLLTAIVGFGGYYRDYGEYPNGSFAVICKLLRGESVEGQNPRRLDYIDAKDFELNGQGEIVDPWGTPYRIQFDSVLKVYSCGSNKVDDHGTGDDVVGVNLDTVKP